MEEGIIDRSHWFRRQPSARAQVMNRAILRFLTWCTVHRVVAHRCPQCHRLELTAP